MRPTPVRGWRYLLEYSAVVWKVGDIWSKVFLLLFPLVVALAFTLALTTLWAIIVQKSVLLQAGLGLVVAMSSFTPYYAAVTEPLYTTRLVDEFLQRGWWRPESVPYFRERVRYLSALGRARFPGCISWGVLGFALYCAMLVTSVPLISALAQILHDEHLAFRAFFVLDVCVSFGFLFATLRRIRKLNLGAEERGYPLASLFPRRRKQVSSGGGSRHR